MESALSSPLTPPLNPPIPLLTTSLPPTNPPNKNPRRSCLLHRFTHSTFRTLSSQTIGVEFASKVVRVGSGARRRRIKLQLWDTAGTERFRSVSRSYYRGAAGAVLVYDVSDPASFGALPTFLSDARALASPQLTVVLAGCKSDLAEEGGGGGGGGGGQEQQETSAPSSWVDSTSPAASSLESRYSARAYATPSRSSPTSTPNTARKFTAGHAAPATSIPPDSDTPLVSTAQATAWASTQTPPLPYTTEVSALSGDGVAALFHKLATIILTRIELGEIDPDDPRSGIQYGDAYGEDAWSVKSGRSGGAGTRRRRGGTGGGGGWMAGAREWEEVFRVSGRRRRGGCC